MGISKRKLLTGVAISAIAAPAMAQLGGLGGLMGGGSKSSGADPAKIEASLKEINQVTSTAAGKLAEALGMKESSAKLLKTADDIKNGTIGLADSMSVVGDHSALVKAEMEKNRKEGKKLDDITGAAASAALLPAVVALPLWKVVIDGVKKLDASASMRFVGLVQVAPKIPKSATSTLDLLQTGVSYLSFSGVDTTKLSSELKDKATGIT